MLKLKSLMNFEKELNENQFEAVSASEQYLRIVAGAGSGKTRVLTYRVAYLIEELGIDPSQILAITFTNKVAKEMQERVAKLLNNECKGLTIKTFHSLAAYFLRREIDCLGFPKNFVILDEEDQTKLIKDIVYEMGYKRNDPIVGKSISFISKMKLEEKYPDNIERKLLRGDEARTCLDIYTRYEEMKDRMFCLDFDDLLLKSNLILTENLDVRIRWSNYFKFILVDEFQDTNNVEFKFLTLLSNSNTSIYVVGDPDQTIYTWRGANQNIILDFEKKYPRSKTIILDKNYRSTQTILDSANKLIDKNVLRVKKNLVAVGPKGEAIVIKGSSSGKSEADFVAREIKKLKNVNGYKYKDICLLYRSNYITLDFEQVFTANNIPYQIYGGVKFYQRKEIKDVLSYFRLVNSKDDDLSFERICNVPRRGIGETSITALKDEAFIKNKSLYQYVSDLDIDLDITSVPKRIINSLKTMIFSLDKAREDIAKDEETMSKVLEDMIINFGYYEYLKKEDDADDRIENVKALFSDLRTYLHNNPESTFDEYLQNIALVSSQDELMEGDFVSLMTVHTAKGLEFPIVFLVRFNEGVFPNNRALLEAGFEGKEEERRLAYVAFTRAKERLYITYASDYSYVVGGNLLPSSFIKESGNEFNTGVFNQKPNQSQTRKERVYRFFDDDKPFVFSQVNKSDNPIRQDFHQNENKEEINWKVGDKLHHKTLGDGIVIALEGDGIITVEFKEHGKKSILGNHKFVSRGE